MKVALAAKPFRTRDIAFNVQIMTETLKSCSGKADLVLFGEAVLQGFDAFTWRAEEDKKIAVSVQDRSIQMLQDAAKRYSAALSFGFLEKDEDVFFSSQIVIDKMGRIHHLFRRVSPGWKTESADMHYREGLAFQSFALEGKKLAIGLCGDLWYEENIKAIAALSPELVLWPVYCDYSVNRWNEEEKQDYAVQAAKAQCPVLLVNPICIDAGEGMRAQGAAAYFTEGKIVSELPSGQDGILFVEI